MSTLTAGNVTVSCSLSADTSGNLVFQSGGNVTAMTIDSSQNVGIGQTPTAYGSTVRNVEAYIAGASAYTLVSAATASVKTEIAASESSLLGQVGTRTNHPLMLMTNATERARIDTSGGLRINTTGTLVSSSEILSATSSGNTFTVRTTAGVFAWCQINWNSGTSGNNLFHEFGTEGTYTVRGSIDYNRGAGQVRYNQTSDATLKNIIGDSDGQKSVEILNSTRIREYAWKDDNTQKPQIGVIAQELYETYKGAVFVGGEQKDGKYRPWGVDKTAFTFHLIAGWQAHEKLIQEQQQMIETLQAKVAALEAA